MDDEAISISLIYIEAGLLRSARNDGNMAFSAFSKV
jgi:hypothetical protein